jgi:hypothetical protein
MRIKMISASRGVGGSGARDTLDLCLLSAHLFRREEIDTCILIAKAMEE